MNSKSWWGNSTSRAVNCRQSAWKWSVSSKKKKTIILLTRTLILEKHVGWCSPKKRYQSDTCLKEIGLFDQNRITILSSVVNKFEVGELIQPFDEHENRSSLWQRIRYLHELQKPWGKWLRRPRFGFPNHLIHTSLHVSTSSEKLVGKKDSIHVRPISIIYIHLDRNFSLGLGPNDKKTLTITGLSCIGFQIHPRRLHWYYLYL